ncbi:arsenic resistance N-acetyltransferase ArsN2 [Pseudoduganella namucuonensis]|uniref:Amino-acid N-acetyltransferase n=1 Tax=Pseudoduganella namucuonensis TaxID=1035707 RepID=A0A1I7G705_9BURK|nr:arsenic resistance N-acetyltransferase ArsN2 [Pseudoduganella namucuonensis]SFU44036.1 amino-acid N-acetyltransferase [Pseudoduganella namucuonensis]
MNAIVAPATIDLRPATADDLPGIERLLAGAGLPSPGADAHPSLFVVGEGADGLVCAGGMERHGAFALLRSVVVADGARGLGLGKRVLARLLEQGRRLDITGFYLLTTAAVDYFKTAGFAVTTRSRVPLAVRQSSQFQGVCPDSAVVMSLCLDRGGQPN